MRIAIIGSHATGKSTLVTEISRAISDCAAVEEPYYQLLSAGHLFDEAPTVADFETLIDASVSAFAAPHGSRVLFDRSPADYLAYLVALQPRSPLPHHVAAVKTALETLDLAVYVPIEQPDRIANPEAPRLRRRVDELLREMLIHQTWGWTIPVLEVRGTVRERTSQVTRYTTAPESSPHRG